MEIEYCPLCGGGLMVAKWQCASRVTTKICPQNHLFDIGENHITPVSLSKCECGEVMPTRDMRDIDKRKVCPKCFEVVKKAWRMDKDKSYARLVITPIKTADRHYYQLQTSVEIRPYPNPFMYGGMYGGNSAKDEELEQAITSFNETVAELKENGLERVEIVRHDELIRVEQARLEAKATTPEPSQPKQETKQPAMRLL